MYSKLPIHGNSLLEQYELCPHRLRVKVVTTYNRLEPPVRLQEITHLARLGEKSLTNKSKFCIWSNMDLIKNITQPIKINATNSVEQKKTEEFTKQKPTLLQKIKGNFSPRNVKSKKYDIDSKKSMIWLMKPSKPLYQSTTNIYEYSKVHLSSIGIHPKTNRDVLTNDTNSFVTANKARNHFKNFKLKRTSSKTTLATKVSNHSFWKNEVIKNLLAKPRDVQMDKYKKIAKLEAETTVTEIIGFDSMNKAGRLLGGEDQITNLKFFPIYSSSSNSQLSTDDTTRIKKVTTKRVNEKSKIKKNKSNLSQVERYTGVKKLRNNIKVYSPKSQTRTITATKLKKLNPLEKRKKTATTVTSNFKRSDKPINDPPGQRMKSIISSHCNDDSFKELSKATTNSSPFTTSASFNTCRSSFSKNIKQEGCQIAFHTPVTFKSTPTNTKSIHKKVSRNKTQNKN